MEQLSLEQERDIRVMRCLLEQVVIVDDMFPPDDDGGVNAMRVPTGPRPHRGSLVLVGAGISKAEA